MASEALPMADAASVPLPVSPTARIDSRPLKTDSLVSIQLPEPVSLAAIEGDEVFLEQINAADNSITYPRRQSSFDIMHGVDLDTELKGREVEAEQYDTADTLDGTADAVIPEDDVTVGRCSYEEHEIKIDNTEDDTCSVSSSSSNDSAGSRHSSESDVDWSELDKEEKSEPRDEGSDESTAFLLARLEQENTALAKNPRVVGLKEESAKKQRPPSVQVLKKLVQDPSAAPTRFSLLPTPPPMTELDFWAALVKDYPQTAQRLPTLTANKIKSGVPPPLRGVVWVSMVGARDQSLSDDYDRLSAESSPYENMIGKDIGRSFPGVDMFKEAGGEGQTMLAQVLKAFSLYDEEIGYCQGLGFLVGPLLMQMGERDAFCVLVKLMEKYDLKSCFMPDLAGLHLRIFQFQRLLTEHLPELTKHLVSLQVEAAYLSQWFLSFFAVTCPLPLLFRIYDVILAEGASETIMRVAMSLMKRNQEKLMALHEFEEVMQLLLGRALWEPYGFNADDLVNDFTQLNGVVTRESLQKLEKSFREAKEANHPDSVASAGFFQDVSSGASRFLGRLWTSHGPSKSQAALLAPSDSGHSRRPSYLLRRSPSKQSIAASTNSTEGGSDSTNSVGTTQTDATAITRDSSTDLLSSGGSKTESMVVPAFGAVTKEDKDLHGQIEDLLTALSEMQRDQSVVNAQLQKEREEREEDHKIFHDIVSQAKPTKDLKAPLTPTSTSLSDRRQTTPNFTFPPPSPSSTQSLSVELSEIVERVEQRLAAHKDLRRYSMLETKQRLRESLVRSKDQLSVETSRSQELSKRLDDQERENANLRDQLIQARADVQEGVRERAKLDKTISDMRINHNRVSVASNWSSADTTDRPSLWRTETWTDSRRTSVTSTAVSSPTTPASAGMSNKSSGLRELKLSRTSGSAQHQHNNSTVPARGSSLATQAILSTKDHAPASEESMLVELVAAKTSEAVARQELEEVRGRMDALRKMLQLPPASPSSVPAVNPLESALPAVGSGCAESPSDGITPAKSRGGMTLSPPPAAHAPSSSTLGTGAGAWFPAWARRTASTSTAAPVPAAEGMLDAEKSPSR